MRFSFFFRQGFLTARSLPSFTVPFGCRQASLPRQHRVVQELLQTGAFKVKAVTRNVSKPAAQRLRERGAELVQADLDDPASLQEVKWSVIHLCTDAPG